VKKINHIAIVVNDIEKALKPYQESLGLQPTEIEYVESFNVKVVFLPIGDTQIELVEPLDKEGDLVEFLRETGGGLHHIAFEVDDINLGIKQIKNSGRQMKDKNARNGAHNTMVAFAEKESFDGVIVELVQPKK
jgi:methylmalonyl-CoA/ethylmalonyl-CoA epimerase